MQIKKVLIVGAGAVGRVIGAHLKLSNCDVSFWVRPGQVEQMTSEGLTLFNLKTHTELHLGSPKVVTEISADEHFDLVFLCVRSDQLDTALEMLQPALAHQDTILVTWQPGRNDAIKTFHALPQLTIVPAEPGFSAYMANNRVEYQFSKRMPTLIGAPFNETLHVRDELVALLNGSGLPTKGVNDLEAEIRVPFSAGVTFLMAFELAGFSLEALRRNRSLAHLTAQAIREAVHIVKKDMGFVPLKYKMLEHLTPTMLLNALWALDKMSPDNPFRTMWDIHSRKIQSQTYAMVQDLIELSIEQKNSPAMALTTLSAMTPDKINSHLETVRIPSSSRKALIVGLAASVGGLLLLKNLARRKKKS